MKNVGEGRDPLDARRPQGARHASTRCSRCASRSTSGWSTSGRSKAWSRPAPSTRLADGRRPVTPRAAVRRGRQGDRARQPAPAEPRGGRTRFFDVGGDGDEPATAIPLPEAAPWTEAQQLAFEKEVARPLHERPSARALQRGAEDLRRPARRRSRRSRCADVWVGGIVSGLRPLKTKKGDRMAVFMLDDIAGGVEVVVFPETFGKCGHLIAADAMLLVRGKFEKDDESARIVATELQPISLLKERTTREVVIHLKAPSRNTMEALAELLSRHRGDRRVLARAGREEERRPRPPRPRRRRPARATVREARRGSRTAVRRWICRIEMTVLRRRPGDEAPALLTCPVKRQRYARIAGIRRAGRRAAEGDRGAQHAAADAGAANGRSSRCGGAPTRSASRSSRR